MEAHRLRLKNHSLINHRLTDLKGVSERFRKEVLENAKLSPEELARKSKEEEAC